MHRAGPTLTRNFNLAAHRPSGWREDYFINQYQHRLRYAYAPAHYHTGFSRRGTIILTHGYGELIDQYYLTIRDYQSMGYDVWAMDHYGFGKSGRDDPANPHRPSTKGMLRHVHDLHFFATRIVRHDPARPLILSTHSMGGHIGLLYLQRHADVFDAAIFSSPMFDVYRFGLPRWFRPAVKAVFNIASHIGFKDVQVPATPAMWDKITRVGRALGDPHHGGIRVAFKHLVQGAMPETAIQRPTFGWIAAAFKTIDHSLRPDALRAVQTPMLIGTAGAESLVDPDSHRLVARLAPHATHIFLPLAGHNLWFENDANHALWLGRIRRFLEGIPPRKTQIYHNF
jgi:lysophospholipase